MTTENTTIRLTTAQAIIRWLSNQFIEIDGQEMRVCGGGFGDADAVADDAGTCGGE